MREARRKCGKWCVAAGVSDGCAGEAGGWAAGRRVWRGQQPWPAEGVVASRTNRHAPASRPHVSLQVGHSVHCLRSKTFFPDYDDFFLRVWHKERPPRWRLYVSLELLRGGVFGGWARSLGGREGGGGPDQPG